MNGTLILFTRYPEPGRVKSRLIGRLGPAGATRLHRALVEHTLATAAATVADRDARLEIHHTGAGAAMREWLGADRLYRPQVAGDLGCRMAAALDSAARPAVLIGSDCPDLTVSVLADAFAQLAARDVVLGPAHDGGFYLIGARRRLRGLLRDIDWGTDQVLAQTRSRLATAGWSCGVTATLADIDRPEDLARLPAALRPADI